MRFHALVVVIFLAAAIPAVAQSSGEIAYFHLNRVKPGMTAQYETTRKHHWLWHKKLGDTWSFHVWQIVSGDATGAYIISSFGHSWKEVDASDQLLAGDEDPGASVEPYLDFESESYYRYRSDLSLAPSNFSPAPKLAVTRFLLKAEGVNGFLDGVGKITEAIRRPRTRTRDPSGGMNSSAVEKAHSFSCWQTAPVGQPLSCPPKKRSTP